MVLENDVDVGLHIEAPFEDSADLGRGVYGKFLFLILFLSPCAYGYVLLLLL